MSNCLVQSAMESDGPAIPEMHRVFSQCCNENVEGSDKRRREMEKENKMHSVIYIVGLVVVVLAVLSFVGLG